MILPRKSQVSVLLWTNIKMVITAFKSNLYRNWSLAKSVQELGIIWNSSEFLAKIPERHIDDMLEALQIGLSDFSSMTARKLAQISVSPTGDITGI
jgi:hypothetical protein